MKRFCLSSRPWLTFLNEDDHLHELYYRSLRRLALSLRSLNAVIIATVLLITICPYSKLLSNSENQNEIIISFKLAENIVVVTNANDLSHYAQSWSRTI